MKAKDTVRMPQQTQKKRKELFPHGHKDCFECEQFVRELQAEITWGIALGEVIGWINETDILTMLSPRKRRDWQAKLKGLEVKDEADTR